MDVIFEAIVGFVAGTIAGPFIVHYSKKIYGWCWDTLMGTIDRYITDPELKSMVLAEIMKAEKALKSNEGKRKLDMVVRAVAIAIPGKFDDVLLTQIVQGIYNKEVKLK